MRVWDLPVRVLCRKHLLAQHNEIHGIWTVITEGRQGYANHPEVARWRTHLATLRSRHGVTAREMLRRGYRHQSPLQDSGDEEEAGALTLVDPIPRQRELLREKHCECNVS
jgi:hypothetical protein